MKHFFSISFQIMIGTVISETGLIGCSSATVDFNLNTVKNAVKKHYEKRYINDTISIVFVKIQSIPKKQYKQESPNFIALV